jgi:chromosome segregation ATPase
MNRQLRVLILSLLWLSLAGCEYLPSWMPGAKSGKAAVKSPAKTPKQESVDDLPVEQQILGLQEEIRAVEEERRKLQQRRDEIQNEKEVLSGILREQEEDLQHRETEINRLESAVPAGG